MKCPELRVPKMLLEFVDMDIWPSTPEKANKQHIISIISIDKLKEFAPDENNIFFYPIPFYTINDLYTKEPEFWELYGAIHKINPNLSLVIGDFGLGSETILILNFSENINNPSVYRLKWNKGIDNSWIKVADNFDVFSEMIGLGSASRNK